MQKLTKSDAKALNSSEIVQCRSQWDDLSKYVKTLRNVINKHPFNNKRCHQRLSALKWSAVCFLNIALPQGNKGLIKTLRDVKQLLVSWQNEKISYRLPFLHPSIPIHNKSQFHRLYHLMIRVFVVLRVEGVKSIKEP